MTLITNSAYAIKSVADAVQSMELMASSPLKWMRSESASKFPVPEKRGADRTMGKERHYQSRYGAQRKD